MNSLSLSGKVPAFCVVNCATKRPTGVSSAGRPSLMKLMLAESPDGGEGGRSETNLKTSDLVSWGSHIAFKRCRNDESTEARQPEQASCEPRRPEL